MKYLLKCCLIIIFIVFNIKSYRCHYYSSTQEMKCQHVRSNLKLNVTRFAGVWYQVAAYPFNMRKQDAYLPCTFIDVDALDANNFLFKAKYYNPETLAQDNLKALISVDRTELYQPITTKIYEPNHYDLSNWQILRVDYWHYAVLNGCIYRNDKFVSHLVWILSREQKPSKKNWNNAYTSMNIFKLPTNKLQYSNHSNCHSVKSCAKVNNFKVPRFGGEYPHPHYHKKNKRERRQ